MKKIKVDQLKFGKKIISKLNSEKITGAKEPPPETWTWCPWGHNACD